MARNSILDLYYGNLDPQTMVSKATPELEQFRQQLLTYEKELLNNLSENDKAAFMNYSKTWTQYQALACEATFVSAFRLGVQLMHDAIGSSIPAFLNTCSHNEGGQ